MRPFAVEELDHVVLRCADQARMLTFYTGVLGLTEERRLDAIGLVQLRAGRSMIDLVAADAAVPPARGNMDHLCLDVTAPSMASVVEYLAAADIRPLAEPARTYGAHGFGTSIYVHDPEGNVVELKMDADAA
jgi:glyoxylase I family protein